MSSSVHGGILLTETQQFTALAVCLGSFLDSCIIYKMGIHCLSSGGFTKLLNFLTYKMLL